MRHVPLCWVLLYVFWRASLENVLKACEPHLPLPLSCLQGRGWLNFSSVHVLLGENWEGKDLVYIELLMIQYLCWPWLTSFATPLETEALTFHKHVIAHFHSAVLLNITDLRQSAACRLAWQWDNWAFSLADHNPNLSTNTAILGKPPVAPRLYCKIRPWPQNLVE